MWVVCGCGSVMYEREREAACFFVSWTDGEVEVAEVVSTGHTSVLPTSLARAFCRTPGRAHASSRPLEPPLLPLTKAVPARPLTHRAHRPRIKKLSSHAVKRGLQRGPRPAAHLPPLAARATPGLPASCPASAGRRAAPHAAYPRRPAAAASAPTAAAVFCAAAWPRPPARPSSPGAPPRRVRGVAGPQRCRGQTGERERERGE